MCALSDYGVLYDASSFSYSASDANNQRTKFPTEVLEKKSGLCVETALTVASMSMSLGMNTFLIFPPGHCMVAVEAMPETGVYILLETTCLPAEDQFMVKGNAAEIDEYIVETYGDYVAIDCAIAKTMGFQTLND